MQFSRYIHIESNKNQIRTGLSGPFLHPGDYPVFLKNFLIPNGLKWTRTTDLTLIRRAL